LAAPIRTILLHVGLRQKVHRLMKGRHEAATGNRRVHFGGVVWIVPRRTNASTAASMSGES